MRHFIDNLAVFVRRLRRSGLKIGTDRLIALIEALQHIDIASPGDVRAACRAILIQRHDDSQIFDMLFDTMLDAPDAPDALDALDAPDSPDAPESLVLKTWSSTEQIANQDFAELTEEELALARSAIANMSWHPGERRTRRWIPGRGARIDLRRALARSLRTGGEITELPRRRRRSRPRPILLLCDVSGSMELYSRTLLHFAHSITRSAHRVEAFLFATRLTRVTMALRSPAPDAAFAAVSRAVRDWSGGTRIGEALRTFHQRWRRRTLSTGAVVILISDGWDRGEPGLLRNEIARLQRSCHRLIWLNPLIGTADYAPLTRGLEAALPFVDDFLPVRTLRDVRELALHLSALDGHHRHLQLRRTARKGLGPADESGGDRRLHSGM